MYIDTHTPHHNRHCCGCPHLASCDKVGAKVPDAGGLRAALAHTRQHTVFPPRLSQRASRELPVRDRPAKGGQEAKGARSTSGLADQSALPVSPNMVIRDSEPISVWDQQARPTRCCACCYLKQMAEGDGVVVACCLCRETITPSFEHARAVGQFLRFQIRHVGCARWMTLETSRSRSW